MPFIDAFLQRGAKVNAYQRDEPELFLGFRFQPSSVFAPPIVLALEPPLGSGLLVHPALPLLLQYGANVNVRCSSVAPQRNPETRVHRWTPLMWAARSNLVAVVRALLDARADPQLSDCDGSTPLTVAIVRNFWRPSHRGTSCSASTPRPRWRPSPSGVRPGAQCRDRRQPPTAAGGAHAVPDLRPLPIRLFPPAFQGAYGAPAAVRARALLGAARQRCLPAQGTENETKVEKPEGGKCYKLAPEARDDFR